MGIYSDYGRFMKARQFKTYCNSGAGIWFAFSIGSERWDQIAPDSDENYHPFVPPSSPSAYTPLYRWFTSYKETTGVLLPQELALLDRSFASEEDPPFYPSDQYMEDYATTKPSTQLSPSYNFFMNNVFTSVPWENQYKTVYNKYYPSPSIPVFAVGYENDWSPLTDSYPSDFDPTEEPTDPSQFKEFAYNHHIYDGLIGSDQGKQVPLGLLSMIQGSAYFVEPIEGEPESTPTSSLKTFKYGSLYWRIVPDIEITRNHLPHHVLLTVTVFPNELSDLAIVEKELPVRQISVMKFPDSMVSDLGLDQDPLPRSAQVIKRKRINIMYHTSSGTKINEYPVPNADNIVNIPFACKDPLNPEDTIEVLINDFMTGRVKDVQQTDRYGYIIGF